MTDLASLSESIKSALGGAVVESVMARGELTIEVQAAEILRAMVHLHDEGRVSRSWSISAAWTGPSARSASTWSITCCR